MALLLARRLLDTPLVAVIAPEVTMLDVTLLYATAVDARVVDGTLLEHVVSKVSVDRAIDVML